MHNIKKNYTFVVKLIKPKTKKNMKKLLFVVAIAGVMTSCKDKKDEKAVDATTTTTSTTEPTTTEPTTTTTTTTTASTGVPTFSDPEVQQFANDYAAFIANYKAGMNDPAKMQDLTKDMQKWTEKSQKIGMKLSQTPDEAKKWADWVMVISKDMMPGTHK